MDGVCNLHGPAKRTWKPKNVRTTGPDGTPRMIVQREYSWRCKLLPGQTRLSFASAGALGGTLRGDTRLHDRRGEELDATEGQGERVLTDARAGINLERTERS